MCEVLREITRKDYLNVLRVVLREFPCEIFLEVSREALCKVMGVVLYMYKSLGNLFAYNLRNIIFFVNWFTFRLNTFHSS